MISSIYNVGIAGIATSDNKRECNNNNTETPGGIWSIIVEEFCKREEVDANHPVGNHKRCGNIA
jgi:hypothetical protein